MFHVLYRHKSSKVWLKFGFKSPNQVDLDLAGLRRRHPYYKFRLLFES